MISSFTQRNLRILANIVFTPITDRDHANNCSTLVHPLITTHTLSTSTPRNQICAKSLLNTVTLSKSCRVGDSCPLTGVYSGIKYLSKFLSAEIWQKSKNKTYADPSSLRKLFLPFFPFFLVPSYVGYVPASDDLGICCFIWRYEFS